MSQQKRSRVTTLLEDRSKKKGKMNELESKNEVKTKNKGSLSVGKESVLQNSIVERNSLESVVEKDGRQRVEK